MANEVTGMVDDGNGGLIFGAMVATGSVVAGDFVAAYQTATDDMFVSADPTTYNVGSVAIQRHAIGAVDNTVVGITLNDAASGETTNVCTKGLFVTPTAGTVTPGFMVMAQGQGVIDYNAVASGVHMIIGKALTGASAASKYVLLRLDV